MFSKNNIDSSNNIIYPSLFNYNYPNKSYNNHFFLEAMTVSNINLWKILLIMIFLKTYLLITKIYQSYY